MDIQFLQVGQAIPVGVLVPVLGAIPVGVLSQRIRFQDIYLDAIIQSVLVGVWKRGVGFKADLLAIVQPVLIGVGHLGGCAVLVEFFGIRKAVGIGVLVSVEDAIPVRILHGRLGADHVHFDSVAEAVVVGVGLQRVCVEDVHFGTVTQSVLISVCHDWVGFEDVGLLSIAQSVQISIGHLGIGLVGVQFLSVIQSVFVCVR